MNVQLYAYEDAKSPRVELDLYEEQPIKITLSAEEITDPTQINSNFSRQFRIPATNNNSKFFKYWYTSGVVDFDVTQKVRSEIHVDGILYTVGQLRLVAAYDNGSADRIDFEVVFLGETKTFSSQVGDGYMNSLDCTDTAHVLSIPYIENSWLEPWNSTTSYVVNDWVWHSAPAYNDPTIGDMWKATANNTNSEPDLGSSDWDRITTSLRVPNPEPVRYILADRGYPYDGDGNQEAVPGANAVSEVAVSNNVVTGAATHNEAFTYSGHPLYLTQFTPIIQVKYLIDKIFASTEYSYTSDSIFNEEWFKDLYIDGIATGFPFTPSGNGESNATTQAQFLPDPRNTPHPYPLPITFPTVQQNNANAYNNQTGIYTCPVDGAYTFEAELFGRLDEIDILYDCEISIAFFRNGSQVGTAETQGGPGPFFFNFLGNSKLSYSGNFNAGDEVQFFVRDLGAGNPETSQGGYIITGSFACTSSPQQIAVNDLLKTDLKIIDWFKSILTKFRLVMVPTVQDPSQFTVKPWNEYIASGDTFDWTYKLDHNKDIKLEPLFFSQDADITFTDQEDIDVTNTYQQDTFGNPFGTRFFVSGNELLSGTKEVTTEFAPTPVSQIEGLFQFESQFIVPKLYERGDELTDHGHFTHEPIVPVQRLLFWNGLQPTTTVNASNTPVQVTWYYTDNVTTKNSSQSTSPLLSPSGTLYQYPRASYTTEIPTLNTTLNLNWRKQYPYYSYPGVPGNFDQNGEDVYQRYWQNYINNVYSPNARKMTAYFNLDSEDLRLLTFDDVIFIKDSYWRILKVLDAPLGEVATIKVELIKLLEYVRPIGQIIFDPADFSDEIDVNSGGASNALAAQQETEWNAYTAEITPDDGGTQTP